MAINDDLQDQAVKHAVFLQRLENGEAIRMLKLLEDDVLTDVLREIERRMRDNISTKRFRRLQISYTTILREGYKQLGKEFKTDLLPIARNEALNELTTIERLSPIPLSLNTPSVGTMQKIINGEIRGQTVKKMFSNLAVRDANKISGLLKVGLTEGKSVPEMVRDIRGTRAQGFKDGILNTTRHNVETIVRTTTNHVTTQAREAVYKENKDVIKSVQWVSTLDKRTTPICASRDGRTYPVGQGPRPPAHMNCRSTTVPVVKKFTELGIPGLKDIPPSTRASLSKEFTGQVSGDLTYPQWFKKQSASLQTEVLGKERAVIFRRGNLPNRFFFNDKRKQLTLPEMRAKDEQFAKTSDKTKKS